MTENFYARYRLLKCVFMDDNIRSHNAQEIESGRVVMVHLTTATTDADVATYRADLDRLTGANKRCLVETAMLPSGFAIVTEFLPNTLSFRAWMDSQLNGGTVTSPGIPVMPAPSAPAKQPPGEFTMMFAPGRAGDSDKPAAPSAGAPAVSGTGLSTPPATPPAPPPAPPAREEPSLFTQMFSPSTDASPITPVPGFPPAASSGPGFPPAPQPPTPRPATSGQPGEFTLRFGVRDNVAPQPASPPPTPLRPVVDKPVVDFTPFGAPAPVAPYSSMPPSGASPFGMPPAMPPASSPPLNAFAPSHQSDVSPLLGGGRVTPLHAAPSPSPLDRQPAPSLGGGSPLLHELPPPLPPLNAPPMGAVQQSSLASPLASAQPPHLAVPPVLPPPSFPGGVSTTPLSMQGGATPSVRAHAGPSEFTQIITGGPSPAIPKPVAVPSAATPVPVKRSIPTGLIVAINIVLLLAIVLVAFVLKKPRAAVPNLKAPPAPTAPAIIKPPR